MTIEFPIGKWSKYAGMVVLIDEEDLDLVGTEGWCPSKDGNRFYAIRFRVVNGKRTTVKMHRLILAPAPGFHTDHIDGNGLNNTRLNLREATRSLNSANCRTTNQTGYQGVAVDRRGANHLYFAQLSINGKRKHLGSFATAEEAARVYDAAKVKLFGRQVTLNFPIEEAAR